MMGWVRLRLLSLLVIVAVAACADGRNEPVPLSPSFNASASGNPDVSKLAKLKPGRARPAEIVTAVIGPEGGSLRLGDFEIIVPAGAVTKKTPFRIKTPTDPNGAQYSYAEFDPSGTFLKPLTIRLPLDNTQPDEGATEASVVWWSGTEWVALPSRRTEDGRIEAETSHFSVYGTSYRFRGVTILGG